MIQFTIENDKIVHGENVIYVGWSKATLDSGGIEPFPEDYDGWFPFVRTGYSFGDLASPSGLFEALKTKYPKMKIAVPSNEWLEHAFGRQLDNWSFNSDRTWKDNVRDVLGKNPHIDYRFNVGDFDSAWCDHERVYTNLVNTPNGLVSCDEPLVEQILRRFGFTEHDLKTIDSSPKLYFTESEIEKCNEFVKSHVGDREYGCLLFSTRLGARHTRWSFDHVLKKYAEKYKDTPVFFYSQFVLDKTWWSDLFPERITFESSGLSLREQIYIKQQALFNIGWCGGVTEAATGHGSDMISLCPYDTVKQNCIRGSRYVFRNGQEKQI